MLTDPRACTVKTTTQQSLSKLGLDWLLPGAAQYCGPVSLPSIARVLVSRTGPPVGSYREPQHLQALEANLSPGYISLRETRQGALAAAVSVNSTEGNRKREESLIWPRLSLNFCSFVGPTRPERLWRRHPPNLWHQTHKHTHACTHTHSAIRPSWP